MTAVVSEEQVGIKLTLFIQWFFFISNSEILNKGQRSQSVLQPGVMGVGGGWGGSDEYLPSSTEIYFRRSPIPAPTPSG